MPTRALGHCAGSILIACFFLCVLVCGVPGELFIIHTELAGQTVLRFAIGGLEQSAAHVEAAWQCIRSQAEAIAAQAH